MMRWRASSEITALTVSSLPWMTIRPFFCSTETAPGSESSSVGSSGCAGVKEMTVALPAG